MLFLKGRTLCPAFLSIGMKVWLFFVKSTKMKNVRHEATRKGKTERGDSRKGTKKALRETNILLFFVSW